MKKIEGYQCELCNELHNDEESALNCERFHIKVKNVKANYKSYDNYSSELIVTFENDAVLRYKILTNWVE